LHVNYCNTTNLLYGVECVGQRFIKPSEQVIFMARIAAGASSDGRRRRSEQSRAKIIEAMLSLVRDGKIVPTAEEVAARADIGLRSVFRHFSDMEMLRREMVGQMAQSYMKWLAPFEGDNWRDQLKELVSRRASAYEETLPFKRAADVRRYKSSVIGSEFDRLNILMRSRLHSVLPEEFTSQEILFESLDLVLSIDAWQRLREDQNLSVEDARKALDLLVQAILHQGNVQLDVNIP
jgi:AcrR family transcriptional regulator